MIREIFEKAKQRSASLAQKSKAARRLVCAKKSKAVNLALLIARYPISICTASV